MSSPIQSSPINGDMEHIDENGGDNNGVDNANLDINSGNEPLSINPINIASSQSAMNLAAMANSKSLKQQQVPRRLDIESITLEFQRALGRNWEDYHIIMQKFLTGKLTRQEMKDALSKILDPRTIRMHNQFLLANLVNAFRNPPQSSNTSSIFNVFGRKRKDKSSNRAVTQYERVRTDILALPVRERKRIKLIKENSGRDPNYYDSVYAATRRELMPKIPLINNERDKITPLGGLVSWSQDILHAYQAPLASEAYELPDNDNLRERMLGILREHGILGGLGNNATEIMLLGLEYHLKNLLYQTLETVRVRRAKKYSLFPDARHDASVNAGNSESRKSANGNAGSYERESVLITIEDFFNSTELFPFSVVEHNGILTKLSSNLLHDDDWNYSKKENVSSLLVDNADETDKGELFSRNYQTPVTDSTSTQSPSQAKAQQQGPSQTNGAVPQSTQSTVGSGLQNGSSSEVTVGTKSELKKLLCDLLAV